MLLLQLDIRSTLSVLHLTFPRLCLNTTWISIFTECEWLNERVVGDVATCVTCLSQCWLNCPCSMSKPGWWWWWWYMAMGCQCIVHCCLYTLRLLKLKEEITQLGTDMCCRYKCRYRYKFTYPCKTHGIPVPVMFTRFGYLSKTKD